MSDSANPYDSFDPHIQPSTPTTVEAGSNPYDAYGGRVVVSPGSESGSPRSSPTRWRTSPSATTTIAPPAVRWPAGIGEAAVEGLALAAGTPGDISQLGREWIGNPARQALGYPPSEEQFFPTSEDFLRRTNQLGLTGNPALEPQSPQERLVRAGVRGGVAAAPLALMGQPILPAIAGGTGGALASQGAQELGLPRGIQTTAGILAGGASQASTSALGRNVSHVARDLGASQDLQTAGTHLQREAADWMTQTLPQRLDNLWTPVDALIPPATPTSLSNFQSTLGAINTSAGTLQPLVERLREALPAQLAKLLSGTPAGTGTPVEWSEVQALRSSLGDAKSKPKIIQDIGAQNLDKLYASISEDMRASAGAVSPEALQAFNSANANSHQLYNLAERVFGRIVREPDDLLSPANPDPGRMASTLLAHGRKDASTLQALRSEVPAGMNELAAAHIRTSPDGRAWAGMSQQSREALVPSPRDRAILDALQSQPSTADRLLRRSTSQLGAWLGADVGALAQNALGLQGHPLVAEAAGGLVGAAVPAAGRLGRRMVTNPLSIAPPILGAEAGGQVSP